MILQHNSSLYSKEYKYFWYFFLTRICMTSGFQIISLALAWQMYMLTRNPLDLGLVGLLQFLPKLFLVLIAGICVDKFDRRKILIITLSLQAILSFILLCASLDYIAMSKWLIFSICIGIGLCRTFDHPALQSILPDIVPKEMLPKAIASSASAMQIAIIAAPALGGFLYVYGANVTYFLTFIMYVLGIIFAALLPKLFNHNQNNPVTFKSMLMGLHYIYNNKDVLGAISLDLFVVLLGGATALLPIFASDILYTSTFGLGLLRSAPAVGALLMSFILAKYQINYKVGKTMFAAVSLFGITTIIFGLSSSFILSFISLIVMGAADVISVIIRTSFIQLQTPSEMRGRVNSVNSLFIGASNQLGEFESGVTAQFFGARLSVILGGLGTLAIVGLWVKWFPSLLHRNKF